MKYLSAMLLLFQFMFSQNDVETGEKFLSNEQFVPARTTFQKVLKNDPRNIKALVLLGETHCREKAWTEALSCYKKLISLDSENAEYHYRYGGILAMLASEENKLRALSKVEDIRDSFEKAIRLDQNHINARWGLIELYLRLPGIFGGSEEKAKKYAIQLLKISPVDGWLAHGHIAESSEQYPEAEKYYKKALETGSSKICYKKLTDLYTKKMNKPEKAKQLIESARSGKS
ncbi:MAG TPA: hypothetical protein VGB50_09735 [Flavobacterium sp.]|jgi:tetratricopeptide (TPR) repeat protein